MSGRSLRDQTGLTLIEVMVAIMLLSGGLLATFGALNSAKRTSVGSGRAEQAASIAHAELEKLVSLPWDALTLTTYPASQSTGPDSLLRGASPGYATGCTNATTTPVPATACTTMEILQDPNNAASARASGLTAPEPLVVDVTTPPAVDGIVTGSAPALYHTDATARADGATVYRYVTNVSDGTVASGSGKRVIVGVTMPATNTKTVTSPVWVSTIITKPLAPSS